MWLMCLLAAHLLQCLLQCFSSFYFYNEECRKTCFFSRYKSQQYDCCQTELAFRFHKSTKANSTRFPSHFIFHWIQTTNNPQKLILGHIPSVVERLGKYIIERIIIYTGASGLMIIVPEVQILVEATCISISVNIIGKYINLTILPSAMGKL